jgi:hypothetical protein
MVTKMEREIMKVIDIELNWVYNKLDESETIRLKSSLSEIIQFIVTAMMVTHAKSEAKQFEDMTQMFRFSKS